MRKVSIFGRIWNKQVVVWVLKPRSRCYIVSRNRPLADVIAGDGSSIKVLSIDHDNLKATNITASEMAAMQNGNSSC